MSQVKSGDTVRIHYTGTLADGTVFDSSEGRDPLEFTHGSGMIIVGLDEALVGMSVGDKKRVEIPAEKAYGPVQEEARQEVPRDQFPPEMTLEVGLQLQASNEQGQVMQITIAELKDESVIVDGNHPLAGKELTFEFEIVSIN